MSDLRELWASAEPATHRFGRNGHLRPVLTLYTGVGFGWGVRVDPGASAVEVAQDLEDLHRWTAVGLREVGVTLPTVVVACAEGAESAEWERDVRARLDPGGSSAATWIVSDGEQPRKVMEDLLNPDVVTVPFHLNTETEFANELEHFEENHVELRTFLQWIREYQPWSSESGTSLEQYRWNTSSVFRDAFGAFLNHSLQTVAVPEVETQPVNAPGAPALRKLTLDNVGGTAGLELLFARHVTIVAGANGAGKSTISNALLHVLTGRSFWNTDRLRRYGNKATVISLEMEGEWTTPQYLSIEDSSHHEGCWWAKGSLIPGIVLRDLTGLLDQHIEHRMNADERSAILQTLRPRPPREEALRQLLHSDEGAPSHAQFALRERQAHWEAEQELADSVKARADELERLRTGLVGTIDVQRLEESHPVSALVRQLSDVTLSELRKDQPRELAVAIQRGLDAGHLTSTSTRSESEVVAELRVAEADEARHRAVLDWLGRDQRGLAAVLEGLAQGHSRWSSVPPEVPVETHGRVLQSFRAVDVSGLAELREHVRRSTEDAERAMRRVRQLRAEYQEVCTLVADDVLQGALDAVADWRGQYEHSWSEAIRLFRSAQTAAEVENSSIRERELDRLRSISSSLAALEDRLGPGQGDSELSKAIAGAVNRVLRRYGTVGSQRPAEAGDGPLSLELDNNFRMKFSVGGRSISTLSTGQKHQFTLARVIAERQLIQASKASQYLGHRCLILDDVASSHDDDALAREALILRQLAYHPTEANQVQLVLFTHNRRLARRYCGLLAPPPGCEAKLVELDVHGEPRTHDLLPSAMIHTDDDDLRGALFRTLSFGRRPLEVT